MTPGLVELGMLWCGSFSYALTPVDHRWGVALVRVEGGRSVEESRAVLGSALRRFALHRAWKSFGDFVRAYEGGAPAPGTRRARIYAAPLDGASDAERKRVELLSAMVRQVMAGGVELAGAPAEHWAAPLASMFPGLDTTNAATFRRTVRDAVRRRNRDWRWVDVPGTVHGRSNVFVSTWASRLAGASGVVVKPAR